MGAVSPADLLHLPAAEYNLELNRRKQQRRRARENTGFDRKAHCSRVGVATRFQPGQFVGSKSPRWKGGKYARLGLTLEGYDRLLALQGGVCAICGKPPKRNRLAVDHNHDTGAVRGLLCFRCNYGIGWFQSDAARLRKVLGYLESMEDHRDARF